MLDNFASVSMEDGRPQDAFRQLTAALLLVSLTLTSRDRDAVADTLQPHARYLTGRDPASAAVLLGAADRLRRKEIVPSVREARDRATATGRALDDAALAAFVADLAERR